MLGLALLLGLSWLPTRIAGGTELVPPLWPLLPILLATRRFGIRGGLPMALLGGVVVGPLTPSDVASGAPQAPSDWLVRLGFFVLIAGLTTILFRSLKNETAASRAAHEKAERMAALLDADVRERKALEDRLRELAFRDPLTGLANRLLLEEHLGAALARARRSRSAMALLCLDLNDFKLVNDSLGHAAGDRVLCEVARRLALAIRAEDLLARHGGDEFLLMLPDIAAEPQRRLETATATAALVFERIKAAMAAPFTIDEAVFHIGASAGVSIYPDDALDADTLHRHADAAMYEAKAAGSSGIAVFDPRHTRDSLGPLSKAAALCQALAAGDMELHYQPIFRLADLRIMGVEALVRWRRSGELVLPGAFLPEAEQTGVIEELGDFVFAELCAHAVAWHAAGLHPQLGVNVSPRQLRRPGLARHFHEEVLRHRLHPSQFVIELTESAWTLERDRMLPVLEELRETGFVLALDDFGAGYSTLSRLLHLPVDVIKIDRAFLAPIPDDGPAAAIVTAILALAEACGCDVVAEGVETEAQLEFLVQRGCSLTQGYWLGRPVPLGRMTALLHDKLADSRRDDGADLPSAAPSMARASERPPEATIA